MSTEFTNIVSDVETILRHCFRVQAARSHEFIVFRNQLERKYFLLVIPIQKTSPVFDKASKWEIDLAERLNSSPLNETEKVALIAKFERMMSAKRAFERLDGDYQKYR